MEYACAVEMGETGTSYTFLTTETLMCVQIISVTILTPTFHKDSCNSLLVLSFFLNERGLNSLNH